MPLQGFDRPRPAPRAPNRTQQTVIQMIENGKMTTLYNTTKAGTPVVIKGNNLKMDGDKVPRLNVVTNFSQPQLQEVKTDRRSDKETILARRLKQKKEARKDRLGSLRSQEAGSGLSPSDRDLVIGLTISNPPASAPRQPYLVTNLQRHKSKTPEIIVTPADAKSPWEEAPRSGLRNRRKATSSVYSRFPDGTFNPATAPPLPSFDRRASATSIETSSSISSWTDGFSDEETLRRDGSRPESQQSQQAILRSNSMDTIAEKDRSQGWWNHIVSPFLDRNGTLKIAKSPVVEIKSPQSADDAKAGNWKIAKARVRRSSFVHSIWADLTSRNMASHSPNFFNKEKDPSFNDYPGVHRGQMVASPAIVSVKSPEVDGSNEPLPEQTRELDLGAGSPRGLGYMGVRSPEVRGVEGMGLAAEYYEAYWHDQNSPTPYFKCENHVCSYNQKDVVDMQTNKAGGAAGLETGSRGLDTEDGDSASKAMGVETLVKAAELAKEAGGKKSVDGSKALPYPASSERQSSTVVSYPGHGAAGTDIDDGADHMPRIAEATAMPMTRAITPLPINPRAKPLPVPLDLSEVSPLGANRGLPYPPDSPHLGVAPSPDAMTPGLRADYTEDRALPMVPPAGTSVAREPAADAVTEPQNPYSRYHMEETTTTFVSRGFPQPLGSNPSEPRHFVPTQQRGVFVEEINDSHPYRHDTSRSRDAEAAPPPASKKSSIIPSILKGLFRMGSHLQGEKDKKKQRKMFLWILLGLLLLILAILIPVLVVTLPRNDMPVQTAWLNISGFPPIPTGIATIVRPNAKTVDGCVEPPTMWSCALPKELQASVAPNAPDQPNFRVEIRFENGTNLTSDSVVSKRSGLATLRKNLIAARDSFTSNLFSPSPAPPNSEDQAFLGNTTDNNTAPFAGEATPFFMSFLDASQLDTSSSKLRKRQKVTLSPTNTTSNSSDPFPDLANAIPAPDINSDGTAAAANLYPLPSAQPLMLYNRGQPDEHYGFYTYFDRSIFLKSASLDNLTSVGVVPDDENGGSTEAAASLRCTWAQTRFLVQIWTNTAGSAPLLHNASTTASAAAPTATAALGSSANDFVPPGSFPYPVTLTMDRHGGDLDSKSVYCYGMDERQHIIASDKKFQLEDRSFGGVLVNPAIGLFNETKVSIADGGPGGIDGGSGGCSCQWQNFDDGAAL